MLTSKEFIARVTAFGQSTAAMREEMQDLLCVSAAHAYQHGDVTFFDRLFAAASGLNRKRAVRWVRKYGFATQSADGAFKLDKASRAAADFADADACYEWLKANATAWYQDEQTMEEIARDLDVVARINAIAKEIDKVRKHESKTYSGVKLDATAILDAWNGLKRSLVAYNDAPKAEPSAYIPQDAAEAEAEAA